MAISGKLLSRSLFNINAGLFLSVALLLLSAGYAESQDGLRLTVGPKGTNQIEVTFDPVIPDCVYEIRSRANGPGGHWMSIAGYIGSTNKTITTTCDLGGAGDLKELTMQSLPHWDFVAGHSEDSDGDGLSDCYEDLVTRTDPYSGDDGYSDPDGDGWLNIQEMQNNTDPLRANLPSGPRLDVKFYSGTNSSRLGKAVLTSAGRHRTATL